MQFSDSLPIDFLFTLVDLMARRFFGSSIRLRFLALL
jgi:hypothetical protein